VHSPRVDRRWTSLDVQKNDLRFRFGKHMQFPRCQLLRWRFRI
jgi:hypothetical protein